MPGKRKPNPYVGYTDDQLRQALSELGYTGLSNLKRPQLMSRIRYFLNHGRVPAYLSKPKRVKKALPSLTKSGKPRKRRSDYGKKRKPKPHPYSVEALVNK